jgi:ribosomal protein S27AE
MQADGSKTRRFCPRCGSSHILKSHCRGAIKQFLLRVAEMHRYRCGDCDKRFYGHPGRKISVRGSLSRDTPR